jgi:hypothetical protein
VLVNSLTTGRDARDRGCPRCGNRYITNTILEEKTQVEADDSEEGEKPTSLAQFLAQPLITAGNASYCIASH